MTQATSGITWDRSQASTVAVSAGPSSFEWLVVVVGLIVQQNGAFISVPLLASDESMRAAVNPFNTIAVAVSAGLFLLVFLPQSRRVASLAGSNLASVLFLLLVLVSTMWSLHPDLTIRRGAGYLFTIAFAGYLVVRFDANSRMRAVSASFAVSAVGSLLFVALFPSLGIMRVGELAGAWRGVFPHKNVLGPVMAVAIFVELYVIVADRNRPWWRFALLATYAALVVLSHSATGFLLAMFYVGGASLYVLWKRHPLAAAVALINCALVALALGIILVRDPGSVLGVIGKDVTLTGRTTLWGEVVTLIRERPMLGWGYQAMWVLGDPTTTQWGAVKSSQNAFLEVTLQLGLLGISVMLMILGAALWRGLRCCRAGLVPLGWFSLVFLAGEVLAGLAEQTLGQNQTITWTVFNILLFGCGLELAKIRQPKTAMEKI